MLQIGAALCYYKLGQTLFQIGATSLLQIRASVVTNWGSYYKLGQPLLQNRAAITNWGKMYYKLGQVLQIRAIITNWGITYVTYGNQCFSFKTEDEKVRKVKETSSKCSHEELNSRMLFHTKFIYAPNTLVIRAVDTDILVITLCNMPKPF